MVPGWTKILMARLMTVAGSGIRSAMMAHSERAEAVEYAGGHVFGTEQ
jgi:hypothetical protein